MKHQRQIGQRQDFMGLDKGFVGEALDQRQCQQHHADVKSPFTDRFRRVAQAAQTGQPAAGLLCHGWAGAARRQGQPTQTHQPTGRLRPNPVDHADRQRRNAQPFVQPVHLVQPFQHRLQPDGAGRQNQRCAHGGNSQNTCVVGSRASNRQKRDVAGQQGIGHHPQAGQQKEQSNQGIFDVFHTPIIGPSSQRGIDFLQS